MGVVELFSKRQAAKREAQQSDEYDWDKYEQAAQPEQHELPTGQSYSMEDVDETLNDPWDIYYTYMETVALPQIDETQTVLKHLNQSIPGEMLPVPGDAVDLPKAYPEAIQQLDTIKNYLTEKLPSSPAEVDQFFEGEKQRSQQERDDQVLQTIEEEGFPEEYEQMKEEPQRSQKTRRTGPPSDIDDPIDPEEYESSGRRNFTTAQLFARR
jgi:hypothetical protein